MGELGRTTRWHRCAVAVVATLVVAATLGGPVVTAGFSAAGAAGAACTTAELKPSLREFMVSQGLPSYTNLVRGKDSLVRLFLSKPECGTTKQSVTVTGISLSVANGTTPLGTGQTFSPTGSFALPAFYTGTPPANSPTDPILTVKGNVLTPCGASQSCPTDTAGFNATFTATLSYTATGVTGTQTVTFQTAKPVAQKSNALRLLVVPMGDASRLSSTQFTTAADAAVQQGMNTLSRILPVPCNADPADSTGACFATSLLSPYGGVRYSVSPATLDLRAVPGTYDTSGKFCGTQSNWEGIKGTLAQFLESWNTANPNTPADRVVGVVDEAISSGVGTSPSGFSCADGMAASGSVAAWVRAMYTTQPSRTGGLLAMEVTHTLGGVAFPRSFTTHSPNSAADGTAPGRAYDLIRRAHIAVSRSAMKYDTTSPWTNDTTLFEKLDQEFFLCHLGGPPNSECTSSGTTGVVTGSGAGITVVMTGTTGFTPATTSVVMSYTADNVPQPEPPDPAAPDPTSDTRLVITGGAVTGNLGVNTSTGQSDHDHSSGEEHGTDNKGILNIAFEGIPGMTSFALYHCPNGEQTCKDNPVTSGGVLLYEAHKQPSRTTISNVTVLPSGDPENWTQDPSRLDTNPAVHTGAVAWVARCSSCSSGATTIHIAPQADRTKLVEIPLNALGHAQVDPAWRVDGAQIAWVANGDIWKAPVNRSTQPYTVGAPIKVYSQGGVNSPAASYVSWSTDSSKIFFGATNGGIRSVPATGGMSSPLVATSAKEGQPATGPDPKVLVYVKPVATGTDIWAVDPAKPNNSQRLLAANGDQPWYGADGKVLFRRNGKIMSIAATGGAVTQVSAGPSDQNPTSSTPTLGYDRPFGSDREVVLANQNERTVLAQVFGLLNPNTKAELRLTCPDGSVFALAVGVEVEQQSATEGTVRATFDESRACGGNGTLQWICTDGFELCVQGTSSTLTVVNTTKPPVATITSPLTGTVVGPTSKLAMNGSGSSAQGPLTGGALKWFVSGPGLPEQQVGTGNQFDLSPIGGAWPSGELTVRLQATAGTQSHNDFEVVIVDATPPNASIVSGPPPFTSSSTATFAFTFGDTGGSDGVTVLCQLDTGEKVECHSPVTYDNLTPGEHVFYLVVIDEAGNRTETTHTFIVDPFAPETVASQSPPPNANGWNNTNVTVSFAATDPSGVQSITYALSGAQTGGATVPGANASVTITAEGTTTIAYYATDNVPQVEATKYLVVNIDKTAPALTIGSGPSLVCSVLLGVLLPCEYEGTASDARSGVAAVEVTLNGSTENAVCAGCGFGVTSAAWSYAKSNLGLGTYSISFRSKDIAGNASPPQSGTLTIQLL